MSDTTWKVIPEADLIEPRKLVCKTKCTSRRNVANFVIRIFHSTDGKII